MNLKTYIRQLVIETINKQLQKSTKNMNVISKRKLQNIVNKQGEWIAITTVIFNYLNKESFDNLMLVLTDKEMIKKAKDWYRRETKGLNKKELEKIKASHKKYNSDKFAKFANAEIDKLDRGGMFNITKMSPLNQLD